VPGVENLEDRMLLTATIPDGSSVPAILEPVAVSPVILDPVEASPVLLVSTLVEVAPSDSAPIPPSTSTTSTTHQAFRTSPPYGPPTPVVTVTAPPSGAVSPDPNASAGLSIGNMTGTGSPPGTGWSGTTHEGGFPPGAIFQGTVKLPLMPWSPDIEISDVLRAADPTVTYGIPVGPTTRELKVTVESTEEVRGPEAPAIDQVYLVSQTGTVLITMPGIATSVEADRQALDVALNNVPVGAKLLVHVRELPVATVSPQDPATTTPVDMAFRMEVQRNDPLGSLFQTPVGVSTTGTALASSGLPTSGVNALYVTSSPQAGASSRMDSVEMADGDSPSQVVPTEVSPVAEQIVSTSLGVSLGPLVSLGGGPLGPNLGTRRDELTTSIDRNERAFDLAMEQWGADLDAPTDPGRGRGPADDDGLDPATPADGEGDCGGDGCDMSLMPLRGPGGLPVLVSTSMTGRGQASREALLASLFETDRAPEPAIDRDLAPLELMGRPDRPEDESVACTDFLTAACGLVLGVGLATGPLYPDLIALVRTCLPRRARPAARASSGKGRRRPRGGLRDWLGI
jgi:hypothetical protein